MGTHKREIEMENERSFEIISRYVPELEDASSLFGWMEASFGDDGSWTISGEMNSYDIGELKEKVSKSFFVNSVNGERYNDDTVNAFVSIEGTLPDSVTEQKPDPQMVLYSPEQKCGHIEPVNECFTNNVKMLISDGWAPDYIPVAIVDSREQGHKVLDKLKALIS